MHSMNCARQCVLAGLLSSLTGCASPNEVTRPADGTMDRYASQFRKPTADAVQVSIAGLRSPGRGLIIDLLVTGASDRVSTCATDIARNVTGEFAELYLQLRDEHGRDLSLGRQRHEFHAPWVHHDWPPPPQWFLAEFGASVALIQSLPFGSPTLGPGRYQARIRPEARDRIVSEGGKASDCARTAAFVTEWSTFEVRADR